MKHLAIWQFYYLLFVNSYFWIIQERLHIVSLNISSLPTDMYILLKYIMYLLKKTLSYGNDRTKNVLVFQSMRVASKG